MFTFDCSRLKWMFCQSAVQKILANTSTTSESILWPWHSTTFQTTWRWTGANEAWMGMDNCGGCQTTPGPLFIHCNHPRWNADGLKSFPSSVDQGGGISSRMPGIGSSGQWWVKSQYATKHRCWYPNTINGITPQNSAGGTIHQKKSMDSKTTTASYWN